MYVAANRVEVLNPKLQVRHDAHGRKCESRSCVNPNHLALGTAKENTADQALIGTRPRGENHCNAKITLEQAQAIKDSFGSGTTKQRGAIFGVSRKMVNSIDCGSSWAHLLRNGVEVKSHTEKQIASNKRAAVRRQMGQTGFIADEKRRGHLKRILEKATPVKCDKLIGATDCDIILPCLLLPNAGKSHVRAKVWIQSRPIFAYVLAWEMTNNRTKPSNMVLRHLCVTSKGFTCIESSHMKLGSSKQNARDTLTWASTLSTSRYKLDFEKAAIIRAAFQAGQSISELATRFACNYCTIYNVVTGKSWPISTSLDG